MTYPNSPVDNSPVVWGWPWHGLIEGSEPSAGTLTFASGREIACDNANYHNTHLWDIGLPAATVETEDPDEQWLNKAIIRSRFLGNDSFDSAAYGARGFGGIGRYPFYTEGHGVMRRQFTILPQDGSGQLRIFASVFGAATLAVPDLYVPYAAAGLAGMPADLTSLRVQFLDNSPDGRRALYALCPWRQSGEVYSIPRSIIEVELLGDPVTGFELAARLVAPWSYTWESSRYPLNGDQGSFMMAVWGDGDGDYLTRLSEVPPGIVPSETFPSGAETQHTSMEAPLWAWYGMTGDVEIVRYRHENSINTVFTGDMGSRAYSSTEASTTRILCGTASVAMTDARETNFSSVRDEPGSWSFTVQTNLTVSGETVGGGTTTSTGNSGGGTDVRFPASPPAVTEGALRILSNANPVDMVILSNKILAPARKDVRFNGAGPTEYWCGDAITPNGVDPGLYKIELAIPGSNPIPFIYGAFNPITGEVVRNNPDTYQTWI